MSISLAERTEELAPTFGELMCAHRTTTGESMRAVSRRCSLDPTDIAQVELGRADITADELATIVSAYGVPRERFAVDHSQVVVDLVSGGVCVRPSVQAQPETNIDATLLVYLELVYAVKNLPATATVGITSLDLDVVRIMLSRNREEVSARVDNLVLPTRPVAPQRVPLRRSTFSVGAVAAAAAMIAIVSIGQSRSALEPSAISAPSEPVAVVQPATSPASASTPSIDERNPAAAQPVGATPIPVNIIEPLVVTRNADGTVSSGQGS